VFDPNNAEATVRPFAHGLRNVIGLTFNSRGELFAAVNGYDNRGSRPFNDQFDPTYRIRENAWYGVPDFSANFEPITDPKFDVPDALKAPRFVAGQSIGKENRFVINHAASNLRTPDRSVIAGLHPFNSSPSGLDAAPASFGGFGDHLFVAEWGDLAPPTNPLRGPPVGSRIARLNPATGSQVEAFIRNAMPGPASAQGATGRGLERPYYVKFGPDGAMYIVDYGIARINPVGPGTPYEFPPNTGAIWKVTRTGS
jgi:glucose/arabinose dehydrogenase